MLTLRKSGEVGKQGFFVQLFQLLGKAGII